MNQITTLTCTLHIQTKHVHLHMHACTVIILVHGYSILGFLCSVHVYRIVRIGEISPVLRLYKDNCSHIIYSQYGIDVHSCAGIRRPSRHVGKALYSHRSPQYCRAIQELPSCGTFIATPEVERE